VCLQHGELCEWNMRTSGPIFCVESFLKCYCVTHIFTVCASLHHSIF
jgi:hypothetical protein